MVVFANGIWKSGTNLLLGGLELSGVVPVKLSIGSFSKETPWSAARSIAAAPPLRRIHARRVNVGLEIDAFVSRRWLRNCIRRRVVTNQCAVFGGHVGYSWLLSEALKTENCRSVVVVREPAAVLASFCKWVRKNERYFLYRHFADLTDEQIVELLLDGFVTPRGPFLPFRLVHTRMLGWRDDPNTLVVKFEDLVGPKGGGTLSAQREVFANLAKFLGRPEPNWDKIDSELFGRSHTFERGSINAWQSDMPRALIERAHAETSTFRKCYDYH